MDMKSGSASKVLGLLIPDCCKQIYVFEAETDFMDAVNSGQMIPLYGIQEHEREYMPVFIAMENQSRSDSMGHCG